MNKKPHLTLVQSSSPPPLSKIKEPNIKAQQCLQDIKNLWEQMQAYENDALEMKGRLLNLILQHEETFEEPGFFIQWLETYKIPRTTAQKLMRIAKKQSKS